MFNKTLKMFNKESVEEGGLLAIAFTLISLGVKFLEGAVPSLTGVAPGAVLVALGLVLLIVAVSIVKEQTASKVLEKVDAALNAEKKSRK